MKLVGKAWKFGDGISTDHIAPGRLFHLRSNLPELAKHVMEDARPGFHEMISAGDFVVGGRNFGQGSSREHAPTIIRMAGIGAVIAKSFARIFFRNSINVGLPVVMVDTDRIEEGDELSLDLDRGVMENLTRGWNIEIPPYPRIMANILADGGLVEHIIKHGGLKIE